MKKLLIFTFILALALMLCACKHTITDEHGNKKYVYGRFIEIESMGYWDKDSNHVEQMIMYDSATKVVYVRETRIYGAAISPYYINNNGVAEVAIYNVNYK